MKSWWKRDKDCRPSGLEPTALKAWINLDNKEEISFLRKALFWTPALIVLIFCFVLFLYGLYSKDKNGILVEDALTFDKGYFSQRLVNQWKTVDAQLDDCRSMGVVLRQIEEKVHYNVRLVLVIPQENGDNFVMVSDAGICWVNGQAGRPKLFDEKWYKKIFDENRITGEKPAFPLSGVGGKWDIRLVKDRSQLWGVMLIEQYGE